MIRPSEHHFIIMAALVVPSEAAAPMAGLEWRALRESWLKALASLGVSEATARAQASDARRQAIALMIDPPTDRSAPSPGARP